MASIPMNVPLSPAQPKSPAGGYLWIALPLIFGGVLAQALLSYGLPVLYPFIQQEFALSRAQVGLITSSYAIGFGGTVMLAGWLADYMGVKRIIAVSLLSLMAFSLAFPLARDFPAVLALVILIGIVSSPLYPATTRAVMDWAPVRIRALAMSLKQAGFPVAGALTAALLPALALAVGWRLAAAATGLLVLLVAVLFIWLYRDAPRGGAAGHGFNLAAVRNIFRNRPLLVTILWNSTFSGLQYTVLTYFMLFMIDELRISAVMAGGLLAVAQVVSSFSRVLWGAASDFVFRGRRVVVLATVGFLAGGWMLVASLLSASVPAAVLYMIAVVIGVSNMSYHGVLTTFVGELAEPGQVGMTVGFGSMLNHLSQMVLPPLFGLLVDVTGSYGIGWRVTAAVALGFTIALVSLAREPRR